MIQRKISRTYLKEMIHYEGQVQDLDNDNIIMLEIDIFKLLSL